MSFKAEEIAKFVGPVPNHDVLLIGREKTNADRIRGMSDEELADWLGKETIFCCDRDRDCQYGPCEPCLLRWLKSPVEQEERG